MNTVFITGGGGGIGRGLAEAFHRLGNTVIIGGRREAALSTVCEAHPGMSFVVMDVTSGESIRDGAHEVLARFPALNCVINNAGIQRAHDFSADTGIDEAAATEEIEANLLGVVRICSAFLPHLREQPQATIVNISSGLAFVPMARVPVYCATKAAVHSLTVSLRRQLRDTTVRVIELIPPYVDTNLQQGRRNPRGPQPMPLAQFIEEAMAGLAGDAEEVAVGDARGLYASAGTGEAFRTVFSRMNG